MMQPGLRMPSTMLQVPQTMQPQIVQSIPKPSALTKIPVIIEKKTTTNSVDERINKILDVVESRLGLKPKGIEGDPKALMNKLPKVEIKVKSQDDKDLGKAVIDTKEYILRMLME